MPTALDLPPVPLTVEGSAVLHQMFRVAWPDWKALPDSDRCDIAKEAAGALADMRQSAVFSLLGHKGDLLLLHFRDTFDDLNRAELQLAQMRLFDYLEPLHSFVSVVELGLYESSVKTYEALAARGLAPHTSEWDSEIAQVLERQRAAMRSRLYPEMPPYRYISFYPMDRKRGEQRNWYCIPMEERRRQMQEHGEIGRRYAGEVKQIITGSIGFDDWEWGVDLFADDPLIFKKLIYEMRFDEVSAVYALFGKFFVGVRVPASGLEQLCDGKLPQ